uniref:Uncharacterized protein n=1 Tax=Anguilla anguilla TaxID=7936 RepID=A0A0E9U1H9_ANGAN
MLLNCYQPILVVERRLRGELKEGYCCVRFGENHCKNRLARRSRVEKRRCPV